MLNNHYPVVIVGAGPTGLTAANLLGAYGIETLVIERNDAIMEIPRAIVIDDEGLRVLQAIALDGAFLATTQPARGARYYDEDGVPFAEVGAGGEEFGFPRRSYIHQPDLEKHLLAGLRRYPHVSIAFDTELSGFRQHPDGIDLSLRIAGGDLRQLSCRQLLAAEGANSSTRHALGLNMTGDSYLEDWLVIDTANDPDREPVSKFFCNTARPYVSIPAPNGGRRYEFQFLSGETPEGMRSAENIARLMGPIREIEKDDLKRVTVYTFQARVIEQWSQDNIHFLGDAAHLTPPFAGQGMNAGLRDGHNLAWKIAAYIKGLGTGEIGPGLLQSYGAERAGPALAMIQLAVAMGDIIMPRDQDGIAFRRAVMGQLNRFPEAKEFIVAMKFKPRPRYQNGLFLDLDAQTFDGSLVGCMLPQPVVHLTDGAATRLDDEIGPGWAILAQDPASAEFLRENLSILWPELSPRGIYLSDKIQASPVAGLVSLTAEPGPALKTLRAHRDQLLFVRPDRYVAAAFWPHEAERAVAAYREILRR